MTNPVIALVLLFGCAFASNSDGFLDWAVDMIIEDIKLDMVKNNVTSAPVPDFEKSFTEKFMGVEFDAIMKAKNGSLSNIATIQRRSKSNIEQRGLENEVTIESEIGLNDMEVKYEQFDASAWHTTTQGKMSARCSTDSFALSVTAKEDSYGACKTVINYANLTSLGSCSVTVGGGGFLNWLRGYLFTFLLNHYETDIANVVNGQIESLAKKNIEGHNLCKFLKEAHVISNHN